MALAMNTPLAEALKNRIQPKLVEIGWSIGGDDSSPLSEYICLMIVNGKTQEQIAAELSGDLLGLSPGDNSATEFARWLFDQVNELQNGAGNGEQQQQQQQQQTQQQQQQQQQGNGEGHQEQNGGGENEDMDMSDSVGQEQQQGQEGIPTGPKAMRAPGANKRLLGQMKQHMERSQPDALHRTRNQGIDKFKRDPPKGPAGNRPNNRGNNRGAPYGRMNGRGGYGANGLQNMNPQQQMAVFQMYQQQNGMMPQFPGQPGFNPHFNPHHRGPRGANPADDPYANNLSQPPRAGSLFDRIAAPPDVEEGGMETESSHSGGHHGDPMEVPCKFGTGCTKPECIFGHPSPAAPEGRGIVYIPGGGEKCSYGIHCKNRKCVNSHPSPSAAPGAAQNQWATDKSQVDCKFFPNCTNPNCPFRHPPRPPCRNGANCTRPDCHFSHSSPSEIPCRFHPCLNPSCHFKHEEGQQKEPPAGTSFGNKVWTAGKPHVSERKFVNEEQQEELIIPGQQPQAGGSEEMDTAPVEDGVE